jgi:hypothetical protein
MNLYMYKNLISTLIVLEIRIRLWVAVHTLRKRYILVASPSMFSFVYLLLFDWIVS